jgi:hypothetical protein
MEEDDEEKKRKRKKNAYRILVRKPEGKLEGQDEVVWTGSIWLRIGTSGGLL